VDSLAQEHTRIGSVTPMFFQELNSPMPLAFGEFQVQADSLALGQVWAPLSGISVYMLSAATTLKDNIPVTCFQPDSTWGFLKRCEYLLNS
jgi:hypothetical protein